LKKLTRRGKDTNPTGAAGQKRRSPLFLVFFKESTIMRKRTRSTKGKTKFAGTPLVTDQRMRLECPICLGWGHWSTDIGAIVSGMMVHFSGEGKSCVTDSDGNTLGETGHDIPKDQCLDMVNRCRHEIEKMPPGNFSVKF
jgi:hypothetical protein